MKTRGAVSHIKVPLKELVSKLQPDSLIPISIRFARTLGLDSLAQESQTNVNSSTNNFAPNDPAKVQVKVIDFNNNDS